MECRCTSSTDEAEKGLNQEGTRWLRADGKDERAERGKGAESGWEGGGGGVLPE